MAKKIAGVDVLLKVTDDAGVKQILGGQTNSTLNREAETINTTDKTAGGFSTSIAGLISWSVDCDGFVVLGDSAFQLIEDAFMSRKAIEIEIRVGASTEADGVTYSGEGYIVDLPLEFSQDNAVTYALSIEGATALTRVKGIASVA